MKIPRSNPFRTLAPVWAASISIIVPSAHAELVGQWLGDSYDPSVSADWTSEEGITGTFVGSVPPETIADGFNGHEALDLFGGSWFRVVGAENPVGGATQLTAVAVFKPFTAGGTGANWYQSSGLIGMEQANSVADWGFGWNGNRLAGGTGAPDTNIFSGTRDLERLYVGAFTWNSNGEMRLFINGAEVAATTGGPTAARNSADIALAGITAGADSNNPFNGQIAELRLYNSDETAQIGAITAELLGTYFEGVTLQTLKVNPTGGTFTIIDAGGAADAAGEFVVRVDSADLPAGNVQVTKEDGVTTVNFQADFEPSSFITVEVDVPLEGGGSQTITSDVETFILPLDLEGSEGSVGTWAIREYRTTGAITTTLGAAIDTATDPETELEFVDGTAPVFNHSDPDTNGPRSTGNFNNDLPIVSNTEPGVLNEAGNDAWIVVGKTQVEIPAPGVYTFSVHSDDGFALRVTGAGGGRFTNAYGLGAIDPGDDQTIFFDDGTGDSSTRGVYRFDAAGTYDIQYLGWDGEAGGFYELAWAEGHFTADRDTNTWQLVGNPADPEFAAIPYRPRFIVNPPGPTGTDGNFGVRTFLSAGEVASTEAASDYLQNTPREVDGVLTVDAQLPFLNHRDPQDGGGGVIPGELPFPGNTSANDDRVITVAKGRITIPESGPYTFWMQGDDGALLRIKGVDGNPDPMFSRATQGGNAADGRFEMSNPNELFYNGGGNPNTRGIIELDAGEYDIEFLHYEGVGGFHYELTSAPGAWPHGTNPPNGFQLVGYTPPSDEVSIPRIEDPGWTVYSSIPGLVQYNNNILGAESRIQHTLDLDPQPENAITTWNAINFRDPEDGPEGSFSPTNPWPLNTPAPDNDYAMRAHATLVVDEAADYFLGFQGDDGGYMTINGINGTATPEWDEIVQTLHPAIAVIDEAEAGSGVLNRIRVETGTGNSRTIGRIFLEPGEYEIRTLVWEGGGGSWWEIIGAKGLLDPRFFNFQLLETGEEEGTIIVPTGLTIVEQPIAPPPVDGDFRVSSFTITGGDPVSSAVLAFPSQPGQTFTIQASTDLVTWSDIGLNVPAAAEGGTTTFEADLVGTAFEGEEKVFFRVVIND